MADNELKIHLATTADTAGLQQADDAMEQLIDEVEALDKAVDASGGPGGGMGGGLKPEATTGAARQTGAALDALGEKTDALGEKTRELGEKTRVLQEKLVVTGNTSEGTAAKLSGKLTGRIQQAGFQIQDFAVQVGGGTSAMTAFGQQAPQFLGAFGPAGSIAGAFIAIGAVAYNVFSKMGDDAANVTSNLELMKAAVDQIAKNKELDISEDFAKSARAIDEAVLRAAALKQEFIETKKAVNALALAQLELAAESAKAARLDAELKGTTAQALQTADGKPLTSVQAADNAAQAALVRTLQAAEDNARAAMAKAVELSKQDTQAQQDKLKALEAALKVQNDIIRDQSQIKEKAEADLFAEREKLDVLRKQREEKEKLSKTSAPPLGGLQSNYLVSPEADLTEKRDRKAREGAARDVAPGSDFLGRIQEAEGNIEGLQKALSDVGGGFNAKLTAASIAADALRTQQTDATRADAALAERNQTELTAKALAQQTQLKEAGLKTGETVTQSAREAIDTINREAAKQGRGLKPLEKEAVAAVNKILNDSTPDSGQGGDLRGALQELANSLNAKDKVLAQGVNRLIRIVSAQAGAYTGLQQQISDLEIKINQKR